MGESLTHIVKDLARKTDDTGANSERCHKGFFFADRKGGKISCCTCSRAGCSRDRERCAPGPESSIQALLREVRVPGGVSELGSIAPGSGALLARDPSLLPFLLQILPIGHVQIRSSQYCAGPRGAAPGPTFAPGSPGERIRNGPHWAGDARGQKSGTPGEPFRPTVYFPPSLELLVQDLEHSGSTN